MTNPITDEQLEVIAHHFGHALVEHRPGIFEASGRILVAHPIVLGRLTADVQIIACQEWRLVWEASFGSHGIAKRVKEFSGDYEQFEKDAFLLKMNMS